MVAQRLITPDSGAPVMPALDPGQLTQVNPVVGVSIAAARVEVDDALSDMRGFHTMQPDEIMRRATGHSARLVELRVRVQRVEDVDRIWRAFRTRELEPTLEELERQYQFGSRMLTMLDLDWRMQTGQGAT